jgi:hypothetical protein
MQSEVFEDAISHRNFIAAENLGRNRMCKVRRNLWRGSS